MVGEGEQNQICSPLWPLDTPAGFKSWAQPWTPHPLGGLDRPHLRFHVYKTGSPTVAELLGVVTGTSKFLWHPTQGRSSTSYL